MTPLYHWSRRSYRQMQLSPPVLRRRVRKCCRPRTCLKRLVKISQGRITNSLHNTKRLGLTLLPLPPSNRKRPLRFSIPTRRKRHRRVHQRGRSGLISQVFLFLNRQFMNHQRGGSRHPFVTSLQTRPWLSSLKNRPSRFRMQLLPIQARVLRLAKLLLLVPAIRLLGSEKLPSKKAIRCK